MQQLCVQQTLQQASVKVHQLAADEQHTPQLLLSLGFHCPPEQRRAQATASRRWYLPHDRQRVRKNYHALLFSVLVLTFFLLLEWSTPGATQSVANEQSTLLATITELLTGAL